MSAHVHNGSLIPRTIGHTDTTNHPPASPDADEPDVADTLHGVQLCDLGRDLEKASIQSDSDEVHYVRPIRGIFLGGL
jgi:hypothetical protein